jgi:bacteriorhodopsin
LFIFFRLLLCRLAIIFIAAAIYMMNLGTNLLIPRRRTHKVLLQRLFTDKNTAAAKHTGSWEPKSWKRWSFFAFSVLFGMCLFWRLCCCCVFAFFISAPSPPLSLFLLLLPCQVFLWCF